MTRPAHGGWARAVLLLPGLALPLIIWGMYALDGAAQRQLDAALSDALGLAVRVGDVRPCLRPPGISLHDVAIGGRIDVGRIDVGVGWDASRRRPRIREVTLVRPRLVMGRLPSRGTRIGSKPRITHARRASVGPRAKHSQPSLAATDTRPLLRIRQGHFEAETEWSGRVLRLRVEELFVTPSATSLRMVSGRVLVTDDRGRPVLTLGATGMDIDSGARRPDRFASLGGAVYAPGAVAPLLRLHRARVTRRASGFALVVEGTPATQSQDGGSLQLEATLGPRGAPREGVLTLDNMSLGDIASTLSVRGVRLAGATITGQVSFHRPAGAWRFMGDVRASGVIMEHPLLSVRPVGPAEFGLAGALTLARQPRRLSIERLRLKLGHIEVRGEAQASSDDGGARLSGSLAVPPLGCQALLDSLPPGFAPTLKGMKLAGSTGLGIRLDLDTRRIEEGLVAVDLRPMSCRVRTDPPAAQVTLLRRTPTARLATAGGSRAPRLLGPANPHYRRLHQISRYARGAFVAAEDTHFFVHDGFDAKQLRRAFLHNIDVGRFARGASTISQQLVKNVFLRHDRTVSRKFEEIVLTWRMEQVVSKARILEAYLNIVEMGPGIYGVEQAAQRYFGISSADLNPLQAVHLAALTPSPRPLAKRFAREAPWPSWMKRLHLLLRLMRRRGNIDSREQRRWSSEELVLVRK